MGNTLIKKSRAVKFLFLGVITLKGAPAWSSPAPVETVCDPYEQVCPVAASSEKTPEYAPSEPREESPYFDANPYDEALEYKNPSAKVADDIASTIIGALSPALVSEDAATGLRTLKTPEEIRTSITTKIVDPRFGELEPPRRVVDPATYDIIFDTRQGIPREPSAANLRASFIDNTTITNVIPTPSTPGNVAATVWPSVANGGIVMGSRLTTSIPGTANPYAAIPVLNSTVRTTQEALTLTLQATCFPTNLRGVLNPVSPNAKIIMKGKYSINGSETVSDQDFFVEFPSRAVMMGTGSSTLTITPFGDFKLGFAGLSSASTPTGAVSNNTVVVRIPVRTNTSLSMETGTITQAASTFTISNLRFEQVVLPRTQTEIDAITSEAAYRIAAANYLAAHGTEYWISYADWKQTILNQIYVGINGPVGIEDGSAINVVQSNDGKSYSIAASLPGDLSMCGGYYSPLMVFFDDRRPDFDNVVDFKMNHDLKTYWPAKGHVGFFIGLLNKNGRIESHRDLFGDTDAHGNGFENLAQYDTNQDGKIDRKDKVFKKLVLWKDNSGAGVFNKKDIVSLQSKIKSINLRYKNNYELAGLGAEYRQRSDFTFLKHGRRTKGQVIDVWFKPYQDHAKKNLANK